MENKQSLLEHYSYDLHTLNMFDGILTVITRYLFQK